MLASWKSDAWGQKPSWAPADSRDLWRDDANVWNDFDVGGEVRGRFLGIQHIFSTLPDTAATVTIEGVSFTPRLGSIIGVQSATAAINLYYLSNNYITGATEWLSFEGIMGATGAQGITGATGAIASASIVVATAGVLSSNTYHLEIVLLSGKRVVGEWPMVMVGGILYPEDAVLEPAPQLQHRAIHLYLYGGETPWPAGTVWKAIYTLEDITVVPVNNFDGDMILPVDIPGVDYMRGSATTFE